VTPTILRDPAVGRTLDEYYYTTIYIMAAIMVSSIVALAYSRMRHRRGRH
jgi:hypothetical protein